MQTKRWVFGCALALLFACGGASSLPDAGTPAASSLRACDFNTPCGQGEVCDISQSCGMLPDGGGTCGPVTGDQRCHRDCATDGLCAPGETCTQKALFNGGDASDAGSLCE